MTIQLPVRPRTSIIPETAPFTPEQRVWLDGFFAGLLSLETPDGPQAIAADALPTNARRALSPDGDDGAAPWHDPAMPIDERMALAEGRPKRRKLFAAMAQQNCGQCGYLCEDYADKLDAGEEARTNLCVPGGKATARLIRQLMDGAPAAPTVAATASPPPAPEGDPGYSRERPVMARFVSATRLAGAASGKDTRHIVFDLSDSGLAYRPGDSFGLFPRNDPALVDAVLASLSAPPAFPVGDKTLRDALIEDYALGAAPDMLFELIGHMVGGDRRQKAKAMAKGGDPDGDLATLDVLGALEKFPGLRPDPEALLEALEPLQPRLYSISSSPLAHQGELHLTVDAVRYDIGARTRLGVASTWLADRLEPGAPLSVYVQKAHAFALPAHGETPIIMVGPGTGVAPFRSFLWHRHATAAKGRTWLFYGHQHEATDFFYREEFEHFEAERTLTKLSTAWSRDGSRKVYVQDRMRENGPELWQWLKAGAHFYVCGDAKRMARDVETALAEISAKAGQMSAAGAQDFIAELKETGRYQTDVY